MCSPLTAAILYPITLSEPDLERRSSSVHFHYPGVRLTRTAEDVCDCCVRLDIRLKDPDISEDEKWAILLAYPPPPSTSTKRSLSIDFC
ncbi:hypothetical protein GQ600_22128 [Phytophthora cactorum]|nr:hypothetical protein GQ600_22128 [Phytophthora cactorum]